MYEALQGWLQPLTIKTITTTTSDFIPTVSVDCKPFQAVVQPTKKTGLNADQLDWSRVHYTFHSGSGVNYGDLVEYKGNDYKIISIADYSDYGFFESIGEATNEALKQCNP